MCGADQANAGDLSHVPVLDARTGTGLNDRENGFHLPHILCRYITGAQFCPETVLIHARYSLCTSRPPLAGSKIKSVIREVSHA